MKLSREETIDRETRRRAYEAQAKEAEDQRKLIKKLDFQEKPLRERITTRVFQALGLALGIIFILALLLGGSS